MTAAKLAFNYPLCLNLVGRLVTVVGAGTVGRRKLAGLLQSGAKVRLIDPVLAENPCNKEGVESFARSFASGDLADSTLVFACTGSSEVNERVCEEARQAGIFCCCASDPECGDFILPAVLRRDPLSLSVSTGGGSPALAVRIRDRLAEHVPDSWGIAVAILAAVRQKWLTEKDEEKYNPQVLLSIWETELIPAIERFDSRAVEGILQKNFGEAFSLAALNIKLPEGMP
jgi:precorrin-2 dehydrogenase / sirohydrochlorin ferrochelatase